MSLTEKYRPKLFEEVKGQDRIVRSVKAKVKKLKGKEDLNFLFLGRAGTGKTSMAMIIAKKLWGNKWEQHFTELNASSSDRGIDTVRGKIKTEARSVVRKLIFLDEADHLTDQAQHALRRTMEKYDDVIFVLTANYGWKIIDPIHSRCLDYNFAAIPEDVIKKRLLQICRKEGIDVQRTKEVKRGFNNIAKLASGDMRAAINSLEKVITGNKKITRKSIASFKEINYAEDAMKEAIHGNFEEARNLIEDGYINEQFKWEVIRDGFYDSIEDMGVDPEVKIRLYQKLKETERNCMTGSNKIIQLVGFLADVWVVKHARSVD